VRDHRGEEEHEHPERDAHGITLKARRTRVEVEHLIAIDLAICQLEQARKNTL
jgi:hypothetical protein